MVQRLRLLIPNAGGPGSIPGQGTKIQHVAIMSLYAAAEETACNLKKKKKDRTTPPCCNKELEQANKFLKKENKSDLSKLWAYQMALV